MDQNGTASFPFGVQGTKNVLYFYSKDLTSGCTSQACSFRDFYSQFWEQGALVLGHELLGTVVKW